MVKVAFIYDFDQTLCTNNMQEYALLPTLGIDAKAFWKETQEISIKNNMDSVLSYMYLLLKKAKDANIELTYDMLKDTGKSIQYYPGVEDYFDRINAYAKEQGIELEHFVISSGTKEIIEGSSIYEKFKKVFACEYHYDENGHPDWPAMAINYTGKTQFLFRINKYSLDVYDNSTINMGSDPKERTIPFSRMVYIADGFTDVPCMQLVKNNGGYSIAVSTDYTGTLQQLIKDKRINYVANADYSQDSELDHILKAIINKIAIDEELTKYQK